MKKHVKSSIIELLENQIRWTETRIGLTKNHLQYDNEYERNIHHKDIEKYIIEISDFREAIEELKNN